MRNSILKKNLLTLIFITILASIAWIFFHLFTASIEVNESKYDSYYTIPEGAGIKTWLPAFFPMEAKNIHFYSNIDLNKFGVEFYLDESSNKQFSKILTNKSSLTGMAYIKKENNMIDEAWCILGDNNRIIYLIGRDKTKKTYYIMNATRYRGLEKNNQEKIREEIKNLCL
ncbi:TPA: hypothetical protein QCG56_005000 [Enterobacter cancerogenus]|nr:hypothetical protein [Enterobacter cancerogenus]HDR2168000.1 hypothetical protein [Enterobacter cancerogenus]HDR2270641.1 hypothetical protein [Enterobacter cancerogenus]